MKNFAYQGPLFFGQDSEKAIVAYDTGSSWVTVTSRGCKNCSSIVYHPERSKTSIQLNDTLQTVRYGSINLEGYVYTDTVCIFSYFSCAYQFKFLGIQSQLGLVNQAQGILGLSPHNKDGQSFIEALYNSGGLERKMFSMLIGPIHGDSYITFGGYDNKSIASEIEWMPVKDDFYWQVELQNMTYNGTAFYTSNNEVFIDSGSSFIVMPQEDLDSFIELLTQDIGEIIFDNNETFFFYNGSCNQIRSKLSNIYIAFSEKRTYVITPEMYTLEGFFMQNRGTCYFGFQSAKGQNKLILGDIFLRGYYTIFDLQERRIGFANNIYHPEGVHVKERMKPGEIVGIILIFFVVALSTAAIVYLILQNREIDRQSINSSRQQQQHQNRTTSHRTDRTQSRLLNRRNDLY